MNNFNYEEEVRKTLKPSHLKDLQKSCLSLETIYKAGYKSEKYNGMEVLSIPLANPLTGKLWFKRYKIFSQFKNLESQAKYLQPENTSVQPYISSQIDRNCYKEKFDDLAIKRILIEGEKKRIVCFSIYLLTILHSALLVYIAGGMVMGK